MNAIPQRPKPTTPPLPPQTSRAGVQFSKPQTGAGHRILLYGPGGIGKTTLAGKLPGPVAYFDLDESLARLGIDASVINVKTFAEIRTALQSDGWDGIKSIVIDTGTKAEELAVEHTLANVMGGDRQKPFTCKNIEDYGYGKGFSHVFDTFIALLGDLDRHCRAGRNVVIVCHDCTTNVPNPAGEDWIRYEPRLQSPNSGKASIRLRVREWADHVLFIGYDVSVGKDGKGRGAGTRTIYTAELPHCMAKSRTCQEQIAVGDDGAEVWAKIIK